MEDEIRPSARGLLAGVGSLLLLGGTVLGVLFFALMALAGYAFGRYACSLIGIAGIGGLVSRCYSFLHPPARSGLAMPLVPWSPRGQVSWQVGAGWRPAALVCPLREQRDHADPLSIASGDAS